MEVIDFVSTQRLSFPIVAFHFLVVEEHPEEITFLFTHFEYFLRDNPLKASVFAIGDGC